MPVMNRLHAFLALSLLAVSGLAQAIELPGPVVTPQWLATHRADVTVLTVLEDTDAFTTAPTYVAEDGKRVLEDAGGHIPGSLLVDFGKLRADRKIDGRTIKAMLVDRQTFQTLMQNAGVPADNPIVVVSAGATGNDLDVAARMYWSLKYYGAKQLAILNGGTTGWLEAGNAVSIDPAATAKGNWIVTGEDKAILADSNDVANAAAKGEQLIDARPVIFYLGLAKKPVVTKAGRIAGAEVMPPEVRSRQVDGAEAFLSRAQYDAVLPALGINPTQPSITYCNTGHLASGAWFVMNEVLGTPSKLYDGSMHEWTAEDRPVVGLPTH
jgi:thiosulfate/3-mercaptopyruvate sulfurtransferase